MASTLVDIPRDDHHRYNYSWILPMEASFDPLPPTYWMNQNWTQSLYLSAIYVGLIYAGQAYMKYRRPYSLRAPLIAWNCLLAGFSILGTLRFAPDFLWTLSQYGFRFSVCVCSYHRGPTAFWVDAFAFSKALELTDTAFLVLRKRPVIFLHWYHHITVLVYTWHAFKDHTAAGRWFIMMNFAVHSLMYTYYALRASGYHLPRTLSMFVTICQLSQMVVGVVVAVATYFYKHIQGRECRQTNENQWLAFGMYLSYFCLFANFFHKAYFNRSHAPKRGSERKAL
jgi:elongation of very long chain fatty acids protein 6